MKILNLSIKDLEAYLWKRLRQELLNPPVNDRFGSEPPESFIIKTQTENTNDKEFYSRLILAIKKNLTAIIDNFKKIDPTTAEQINSLACLAMSINPVLEKIVFNKGLDFLRLPGIVSDELRELGHLFLKVSRLELDQTHPILSPVTVHLQFAIDIFRGGIIEE